MGNFAPANEDFLLDMIDAALKKLETKADSLGRATLSLLIHRAELIKRMEQP